MKDSGINIAKRVNESVRFIHRYTRIRATIGIVLGSGLGDFADSLTQPISIETTSIPHFPQTTIVGHRGRLVFGKVDHISVCALQGRVHFYESGDLESVLYPIRILHALGIKWIIVTNASGGINREFTPGNLMVIADQINLTFQNPLKYSRGPFVSHRLYDEELQKVIEKVATEERIELRRGVYCGWIGPSYETAAEIEMARRFGADAAGMSTVNEVALAAHLGMRVAGISCITNLSTGISAQKLSHDEVTEVANRVKDTFRTLLTGIVREIGNMS